MNQLAQRYIKLKKQDTTKNFEFEKGSKKVRK